MDLGQLARWLALTTEIASRGWTAFDGREAERVAYARFAIAERLQQLADDGALVMPPELAGIPLDQRLIPAAFRQKLTAPSDREVGTEQTFTTSTGGAL